MRQNAGNRCGVYSALPVPGPLAGLKEREGMEREGRIGREGGGELG